MVRTQACLALALFAVGACRNSDGPTPADLSTGGGGDDLAMQMVRTSTIRELNSATIPDNTMVRVQGVVISPRTWIDVSSDKASCEYNLYIAQPDQSPTLQDGMLVFYTKRESGGDMGLSVTRCADTGKDLPILKIMPGQKVEVTGRFNLSMSGYRQIYAFDGAGITDLGKGEEIKPVPIAPKDYVNGTATAFKNAAAALVQFTGVKSSERMVPFSFKVATADAMTMKATIQTGYLRVATMNYMPPADDTEFTSVTGIVNTDFGGSVWPRSDKDLVAK